MLRSERALISHIIPRIFLLSLLCSSLVLGLALPAFQAIEGITGSGRNAKRDVWRPLVTYPKQDTVWLVGDTVKVTWSTENPPKQITNPNGILALRTTVGFVLGPGGLAEPLAGNFSLFNGQVDVQVPDVPARDDYRVVLMGDSGNASPYFTITNAMLAPLVRPF